MQKTIVEYLMILNSHTPLMGTTNPGYNALLIYEKIFAHPLFKTPDAKIEEWEYLNDVQ